MLRGTKLYKPIIAAVNGTCVAGGMEMLGGTDLRVASDTATFGVMEPKRGLFAGGGTTVRLPRQIPYPAAMELLLCADQVPAQRAYEMGLLNEVCRPADLMERAYDYAHRITANGPFAVRKTKESVLRGLATDMHEAYRIESEISGEVFSQRGRQGGAAGLRREAGAQLAEPLSLRHVRREPSSNSHSAHRRDVCMDRHCTCLSPLQRVDHRDLIRLDLCAGLHGHGRGLPGGRGRVRAEGLRVQRRLGVVGQRAHRPELSASGGRHRSGVRHCLVDGVGPSLVLHLGPGRRTRR